MRKPISGILSACEENNIWFIISSLCGGLYMPVRKPISGIRTLWRSMPVRKPISGVLSACVEVYICL